ncbi:MAG: hypothetical protein CR997_00530 [Acidobacteria bacterium]|nr:MAG: hypothetical protein CR997_00530 [Acidobacteriota bacterium]
MKERQNKKLIVDRLTLCKEKTVNFRLSERDQAASFQTYLVVQAPTQGVDTSKIESSIQIDSVNDIKLTPEEKENDEKNG